MNHLDPKRSDPARSDHFGTERELEAYVYCDVCFLAFGSQEPRLRRNNKTVHRDCLIRAG